MAGPGLQKAGIITKPYGLRGEVYIILEPLAVQFMETDIPLFIDIDGQRVPFFVEELELISDEQAIIKFEFIDSPEAAKKVAGCPVYFDTVPHTGASDMEGDLSGLIGYNASDRVSGQLGTISDYLIHPMNPVFVIKAAGSELMVPAVRDFIEAINHTERTVLFNLPEGLSSL